MEKIIGSEIDLKENTLVGELELDNATVEFSGKDNILCCKGKIKLENCKLRFTGSNSLIYLDENKYPLSINIRVGNDSVFYLGKKAYLNKTSHFYATERKNIIIGNECLFSFDSYLRTADPHLIYNTISNKRMNFSKSILIGDHVWIGQECLILKNTFIGSGAIVGGRAVISGKKVESNTIYAGNPARRVKEHVFYSTPISSHNYTYEDEVNSEYFNSDEYVYWKDEHTIDMKKLDECLFELKTAKDKMKYIDLFITNNSNKNRFYL